VSMLGSRPGAPWALPALAFLVLAAASQALPLQTTREDFRAPGTQPLSLVDEIETPNNCTSCHANFGQPEAEPYRTWQGSMMAQSGRDPLMWAALAIANQDAEHAGETCLRCHLPKGWLEGRSAPEDGTAMTAADRQGVQCGVCHRLVDPVAAPENPAEDAAILAALTDPVTILGNAAMVVDPVNRLRGPFDIVADLGSDPHLPARETLVSPFHSSSEMCATCHNLRIPTFTKNELTGEYELNALDTPSPDIGKGFPEQLTYDEWAASDYATGGVYAPQFGRNKDVVSTCQDCHMPDVSGRDASLGIHREDLPRHEMSGANTFILDVLPHHPAFGGEVDEEVLQAGIERNVDMLRRAATLTAELAGGNLTVRVTNETGHKLPTGYPEGRRLWLHVRALDADRNVVFESGRYTFASATLHGYEADLGDPDHDPHLHVWETKHGISAALAAQLGVAAGPSSHLALNNKIYFDNRIPPRGFTNAGFAAIDAEPVGATYADGQYWDEVVYPVGGSAVQAEAVLYYQTASREYIEFLRDENTTNSAGFILFDLWNEHNKSEPVEMARAFVETDAKVVTRCQKSVSRLQQRYLKTHMKEWNRCFEAEARGLNCDEARRDEKIAGETAKLRAKLGGLGDRQCGGANLTPISLGHGNVCPVPCATTILYDMEDLADCSICTAAAVNTAALGGAYGSQVPDLPASVPPAARACQKQLGKAASILAVGWTRALAKCEQRNASGKNNPPADCGNDPKVAKALDKAAKRVALCDDFAGLAGCGGAGDAVAVAACLEDAVGAVVPAVVEVPFP
jgi:hypothetical protein